MDEQAPPGQFTYVRATLRSWWDNLPLVILAGVAFILLCAPAALLFWFGPLIPALLVGALTVVPAWVALLAQIVEIVRDVKTGIGVMLRAFPRYWVRSAGLGLLASFPAFAAVLTLPAFARDQVGLVVWLGLAADLLGALVLASLLLYALPLIVMHDMPMRVALRNAVILASRYMMNTLGLLGMAALFVLATLHFSAGLVFFWPAFWGVFVVNNCRMVVAQEVSEGN
jgi:uncharacterized membrane protein YesL